MPKAPSGRGEAGVPSGSERQAWSTFLVAMGALAVAFALAVYSRVAVETGSLWSAAVAALGALALAGWTGITTVPALARRSSLRWLLSSGTTFRLTRPGIIYLAAVLAVTLAALNTGNNLLFLILGCMLAALLLSGILSRMTLADIEARLELPEHVFAEDPAPAVLELRNRKQFLPSFSLRVLGADLRTGKKPGVRPSAASGWLEQPMALTAPLYFPHLAHRQVLRQRIELLFPRRGLYRQDALALESRFPFGFLEKTRRIPSREQIVVYPAVAPTEPFYQLLPLISGEFESFLRGRGHDLYAIRQFAPGDGARFVDWKATARSGSLKVRDFTREDERRVLLALDPFAAGGAGQPQDRQAAQKFESAVSLCACLAWHFQQLDAVIGFRLPQAEVPLGPARNNIFDVLGQLALAEPSTGIPAAGGEFLRQLGSAGDVYKIVFTSQPRGSIPTPLWSSSYFIFIDRL